MLQTCNSFSGRGSVLVCVYENVHIYIYISFLYEILLVKLKLLFFSSDFGDLSKNY